MQTTKLGLYPAFAMLFALACSDNSNTQSAASCLPGETRACLGQGQCKGIQVCAVDGHSLSSCDCSTGSNVSAAGSSTRGEGTGSSGAGATGVSQSAGATSSGGIPAGGAGLLSSAGANATGSTTGIGVAGASGTTTCCAGTSGAASNGGAGNATGGGSSVASGGLGTTYGGSTASGGSGTSHAGAEGIGGAAQAGASAGTANTAGAGATLVKTVSGNPGSFLEHIWSYGFGPSVGANRLAIGPDASIYVLGSAPYNYSFGAGGSIYSEQPRVLLRRASNGRHLWDVRFADSNLSFVMSVDGTGRVLVQQTATGYSTNQFTINSNWLCGLQLPSQKFTTSYVSALSANGACAWASSFSSLYASLTPTGDLLIGTSSTTQRLTWNDRSQLWSDAVGASLMAIAPNDDVIAIGQDTSLQVSRLQAATGVASWRKSTSGRLLVAGAPYDVLPRAGVIQFRSDGSMIWSDTAQGNTQLWGLAVPAALSGQAGVPFVMALASTGDYLWGITAEGSQIHVASAINGDTVVCGTFKDVVSFIGQELRVPGDITTSDVYMALLGPTGSLKRLEQWRLADNQSCAGIAFDQNGDLVAVGGYNGTLDFGGGELPTGANMMYLAKFRLAE